MNHVLYHLMLHCLKLKIFLNRFVNFLFNLEHFLIQKAYLASIVLKDFYQQYFWIYYEFQNAKVLKFLRMI